MSEWYDSRVKKPSPNHFNVYPVVFEYLGSIMHGYGHWMPTNNYTSGTWEKVTCQNTNDLSDSIVLYWTDLPQFKGIISV